MNVYYAYPNIRGCRNIDTKTVGQRLFRHYTEVLGAGFRGVFSSLKKTSGRSGSFLCLQVAVEKADAPIAGFLKVSRLARSLASCTDSAIAEDQVRRADAQRCLAGLALAPKIKARGVRRCARHIPWSAILHANSSGRWRLTLTSRSRLLRSMRHWPQKP